MILYNTTGISHLEVGKLVFDRIHRVVTFFTEVKNLHDFPQGWSISTRCWAYLDLLLQFLKN